uniref:uncharacterized protein LOC128931400 n=1 Tax=Callithrix jacchus TaxID=9483 RepID=UPI0023DCF7A1|nr:uncharacterized protein LOC128931400 [Callithrix jacchus]
MGDSAFPGLQTLLRRGTSLIYSAVLRCHHSCCTGLRSRAGDPCGSSKPQSEGELALFTLLRELPRRGGGEAAAPATRVALAAHVGPPSLCQKGSQSCLLCSESCCAEAPATRVALAAHVGPPSLCQKGSQSCLLCSESCCAEVPAKPLCRPQELRWQPVWFLHCGSSAP